ncbi:MAG TPA: hypothetical protein PLO09_11510, partial [Pseudomonadales bacterium]|nr:hypothetical protein [Pseudomonadales bacterium]
MHLDKVEGLGDFLELEVVWELGTTDHGFPLRFSAKAEQKPGNRGLSPIPPGLWNDSHWSERMSGAESR